MHGLYLITNDDPLDLLLQKLQIALATGQVALLQYRRKKILKADQSTEIEKILVLCQSYQVPLIINDDLDQAKHFAVHLHLGQSDGSIAKARQVLGTQAIIGCSCENSLQYAQQAVKDGASYIAFGAIYGSSTKPEAGESGIEIVRQARQNFALPICAIGGLTVENSSVVIAAGADMCAVISDILDLDLDQLAQRVEAWAALFLKSDV